MDDATLDSLKAALTASPDNAELRAILVQEYLERGQADEALSLVRDGEPASIEQLKHRMLAARAALGSGEPEAAYAYASVESPEALILRARACLALERHDEGLEHYRAAVAANSSLEDVGLRDRLSVNVRTFRPRDGEDGRPKLRVVSNDPTDDLELNRLLLPQDEEVTFADVGGLDDIKKQIRRKIILPFQKPSLFQRFKKRLGGGILLFGPPGCGKTMLARATAGECNATFLNVAIADVLDMYIGESERKLHAIFEKARSSTPSVLFFDEIEALGGKRQYTREATSSKLVSQFLAEMDGFSQNNSGVLILAATNVPWAVDPAFRRPGRFDRMLFVPPPDRRARQRILELLLADRPLGTGIDAGRLAQKTTSFSGADLKNLVESAADEAIEDSIDREQEIPISGDHLKKALKEVRPTTLEWLTTARNYARYANEAGHYDDVLRFLAKHGKG